MLTSVNTLSIMTDVGREV